MQTKAYSQYLSDIGALIGVPTSRLSTEMAAVLNVHFNAAIRRGWIAGNWIDLCPYGEARFVGNRLTYPNNLSKTAYWTATALTITANDTNNPADSRVTASKLMETAATSAHSAAQSNLSLYPGQTYLVSFYARRNGRDYVQMAVSDGSTTFSAFYNLNAGTVGTTSNVASTTMTQGSNGFYLCQFTFVASTSSVPAGGSATLSISTDGSTTSYAGDTSKGIWAWGVLLQQMTSIGPMDSLVSYTQTGEDEIETVFEVYKDPPLAARYPRLQPYKLTPDGIEIIARANTYSVGYLTTTTVTTPTANPVFVYYRKDIPDYTGDVFSASATYAVDDQVYYVASNGKGNFYKCTAATSAGQDPDDTPSKWDLLEIPEVLFRYTVYQAYADWLISDGQQEKSVGMYALAQNELDREFDRQERQQGEIQPIRVFTHSTQQSRF